MDSSFLKYYSADAGRCQEKKRTSTSCGRAGSLFQYDDCVQNSATATRRTSRAHSHATAHWFTTMMVAHLPPSSRLTEATAAMQGGVQQAEHQQRCSLRWGEGCGQGSGRAEEDEQRGHHALLGHKAGDEGGGDAPVCKAQRGKQRGDIARDARQNAGLRVSGQPQLQVKVLQEPDDDGSGKDDRKGLLQEVPGLFPTAAAPRSSGRAGGSWAAP